MSWREACSTQRRGGTPGCSTVRPLLLLKPLSSRLGLSASTSWLTITGLGITVCAIFGCFMLSLKCRIAYKQPRNSHVMEKASLSPLEMGKRSKLWVESQ